MSTWEIIGQVCGTLSCIFMVLGAFVHKRCHRCKRWRLHWTMRRRERPQYHDSGFERVYYCRPCDNLKALDDAARAPQHLPNVDTMFGARVHPGEAMVDSGQLRRAFNQSRQAMSRRGKTK